MFTAYDLKKGIEILAKLLLSFSVIVCNMMKLLIILFIMKFFVAWNTRKVHYSSFSFKDNIKRFRSANYEDNCSCGENYIGKSVRDAGIR